MKNVVALGLLALGLWGCGAPTGPSIVSTTEELIAQLQEAGSAVRREGPVSGQPLFSIPGNLLSIDGSGPRVQVYEYASARRAAEALEEAKSLRETLLILWIAPPQFYRAGRLVVVYFGISPEILQLLAGILGPPVYGDTGS